MQLTTRRTMLTIMLGMVVAGFAGCGGGGGSPAEPDQSATVTGFVLSLNTDSGDIEGLAGAEVSIATETGTSDTEGYFSVTGVPAGQQQLVAVTLPDFYIILSSEPIYCDAVSGQTTQLAEPIMAVPEGMGVPDPPSL